MKKIIVLLLFISLSISMTAQSSWYFEVDGFEYYPINSKEVGLQNCKNTGNVIVPSKVTYEGNVYNVIAIKTLAFSNRKGIESIEISEGVTMMGFLVFKDSDVKKIIIPASVKIIRDAYPLADYQYSRFYISSSLFVGCTELDTLIVHKDNPYYSSEGNVLYSKDKTILYEVPPNKEEFVVPNTVRRIVYDAFCRSQLLKKVIIPSNVKQLGGLNDCSNLESITLSEGLDTIEANTFMSCTSLDTIIVPSSVRFIGQAAFGRCSNLKTLKMHLENSYYYSFENVIYDNTKTKLVACAAGKEGDFEIDNRIIDIMPLAFSSCNLSSVTIPENVKLIGGNAFENCNRLERVNYNAINATVYGNINNYTYDFFGGCPLLTTVNIGNKVNTIPENIFYSINFISLTIPNSVKKIELGAFFADYDIIGVKVLSRTPPSTKSQWGIFTKTPIYIPKGSIEAYKSSPIWEKYANYYEFPFNDITLSVNNKTMGYIQGPDGCEDGYVDFNAIANYGYSFERWSDEVTDNPRMLFITSDTSLKAIFKANQYKLNVSSSDTTKGRVEGSGIFDYNTTQTIRAIANDGYDFDRWSTGLMLNPASVRITEDIEITANFKIKQYELSILSSDTLRGFVEGSGKYDYNTTQTIKAIAKEGYVFDKWNDDNTDNPREIVLLDDTSFTAIFKEDVSLDFVNNRNQFLIYPNPATKEIVIVSDNFNIGSKLFITDIRGVVIKAQTINKRETQLDVSAFAKGIYFIRINNAIKKLIVE